MNGATPSIQWSDSVHMFEHIDFSYLLATNGYQAVFNGCLLEGETILILGGMAAHQHVL